MTQATKALKPPLSQNTADQAPQIQVTNDYGQFKIMQGNRPLNQNHIKRLKRSMEADPQLLPTNPIQVNEHMYIIDGQHRYHAARELGAPLFFVVVRGGTLDETRILNVTQRRWTLMDFAISYANSGRPDYVKFVRYAKEFPSISPSILRMYLAGGQLHNLNEDFSRGEFVIANEEKALDYLRKLTEVIVTTHTHMNKPMAVALYGLFEKPKEFDFEVFLGKLDREKARELFNPMDSVRGSLRSIEEVYNFQSKYQKRLY